MTIKQENKNISFDISIKGNSYNSANLSKLTKGKETDKAICFHQTKTVCTYHPPGMIGSSWARYAKKRYYYWIPKSVLSQAKKYGISNIEDKTTDWTIILPEWYGDKDSVTRGFKVSREHFMKKVRPQKKKNITIDVNK